MKYYAVDKASGRTAPLGSTLSLMTSLADQAEGAEGLLPRQGHHLRPRYAMPDAPVSPSHRLPAAGTTGRKYHCAFQACLALRRRRRLTPSPAQVLTPKRTYFMIAASPEDLALWQRVPQIELIVAACLIRRSSGAHAQRGHLADVYCREQSADHRTIPCGRQATFDLTHWGAVDQLAAAGAP